MLGVCKYIVYPIIVAEKLSFKLAIVVGRAFRSSSLFPFSPASSHIDSMVSALHSDSASSVLDILSTPAQSEVDPQRALTF